MKRSDLKVGDEVYYASPYEWANNQDGQRAVVAAVEPHEKRTGYGWRLDQRITQTSKGNGVLVDVYGPPNPGKPQCDVVQLGHLRGPYAQIHAEVEERAGADRAVKDAREQRRQSEHNGATELSARADTAGLAVSWVMDYRADAATFHVPPAELAKLLDVYEARQAAGEG